MKFLAPFALGASASIALAAVIPQAPLHPSVPKASQQTKSLIELAPYQTRWVTEEEKWSLKLVSRRLPCRPSLSPLAVYFSDLPPDV